MDILYFAWVRERIGAGHEQVDPPADVVDVRGLVKWLAKQSAAHAEALDDEMRLRAAVDQRFVDFGASVAGAREVAIFPPVTGG